MIHTYTARKILFPTVDSTYFCSRFSLSCSDLLLGVIHDSCIGRSSVFINSFAVALITVCSVLVFGVGLACIMTYGINERSLACLLQEDTDLAFWHAW